MRTLDGWLVRLDAGRDAGRDDALDAGRDDAGRDDAGRDAAGRAAGRDAALGGGRDDAGRDAALGGGRDDAGRDAALGGGRDDAGRDAAGRAAGRDAALGGGRDDAGRDDAGRDVLKVVLIWTLDVILDVTLEMMLKVLLLWTLAAQSGAALDAGGDAQSSAALNVGGDAPQPKRKRVRRSQKSKQSPKRKKVRLAKKNTGKKARRSGKGLVVRYPELVGRWDSEANGPIENFQGTSLTKVTWKNCPEVDCHRFVSTIKSMIERIGQKACNVCAGKQICTKDLCNSAWVKWEHLRSRWSTNNPDMKTITSKSTKVVELTCPRGHVWRGRLVDYRCCPSCLHRPLNETYPELMIEWDPANGDPARFMASSSAVVGWKCRNCDHHKWKAAICSRTGTKCRGCPICANRCVCPVDFCNSLAVMFPELLIEWHPKNGPATAVTSGSTKPHWWRCKNGHEWEISPGSRTKSSKRSGCPSCLYKSEGCARDIFERLFPDNEPFVKARPSFLGGLELDGFCEELGLAFEYNGVQHEQETPYFHRTPTAFFEQCERDAIKVVLCADEMVNLVVIPSSYTFQDPASMEGFIRQRINELFQHTAHPRV